MSKRSKKVQATVRLKAHKTLDGNILIKDHDMMDIVVIPAESKIMTMPKFGLGDEVYYYQKFLLDSLARTGTRIEHYSGRYSKRGLRGNVDSIIRRGC